MLLGPSNNASSKAQLAFVKAFSTRNPNWEPVKFQMRVLRYNCSKSITQNRLEQDTRDDCNQKRFQSARKPLRLMERNGTVQAHANMQLEHCHVAHAGRDWIQVGYLREIFWLQVTTNACICILVGLMQLNCDIFAIYRELFV